jgi:uncharacterized membrane protein YhhN
MIVGSLIAMYIANVRKQDYLILTALIFAMIGDVFLMIPLEDLFTFGLGAFLFMQVLYGLSFKKNLKISHNWQYIHFILILFIAIGIVYMLYPSLGSFLIPVVIYILAITFMIAMAIFSNVNSSGYWWIVIGAVFFMISDALLAFNKFQTPFTNSEYWIITTYAIAQLLIISGLVLNYKQIERIKNK